VGDIVGLKDIELVMELEDEFGIDLPDEAFFLFGAGVKSNEVPPDPTVGEIHSRLCAVIAEHGRPVPADSWHRFRKRIMKVFDVTAEEIRPDTTLYTDLGASR
jgi:hypothetical protein